MRRVGQGTSVNYQLCSSVPFISVSIEVGCHVAIASSPFKFSADDRETDRKDDDVSALLFSRVLFAVVIHQTAISSLFAFMMQSLHHR